MFDTQQAIIAHLKTSELVETSVSTYAGEIQKAVRDRKSLSAPAVLVMFVGGKPVADERRHLFDLLVITESATFDEDANLNANLALSAQIAEWLEENCEFEIGDYTYVADTEDIDAELLLQDDKYTIVALHVPFVKYS